MLTRLQERTAKSRPCGKIQHLQDLRPTFSSDGARRPAVAQATRSGQLLLYVLNLEVASDARTERDPADHDKGASVIVEHVRGELPTWSSTLDI